MQDDCISCFQKEAVLVHDMQKMKFDSRQDARLRFSIERCALEYPSQREQFQQAVTELEARLSGAALTRMREARVQARRDRVGSVK